MKITLLIKRDTTPAKMIRMNYNRSITLTETGDRRLQVEGERFSIESFCAENIRLIEDGALLRFDHDSSIAEQFEGLTTYDEVCDVLGENMNQMGAYWGLDDDALNTGKGSEEFYNNLRQAIAEYGYKTTALIEALYEAEQEGF